MFIHNLSRHTTPWVLSSGVSAGNGDTQSTTPIDLANSNGVLFFITLGVVSSGGSGTIKVQMSTDFNVTDPWSDVQSTGFAYAVANSTQGCVIDLYRPQKRYLRIQTIRGGSGNTVIASVTALSYHDNIAPNTPGTTTTTGNIMNVTWLSNSANGAA